MSFANPPPVILLTRPLACGAYHVKRGQLRSPCMRNASSKLFSPLTSMFMLIMCVYSAAAGEHFSHFLLCFSCGAQSNPHTGMTCRGVMRGKPADFFFLW